MSEAPNCHSNAKVSYIDIHDVAFRTNAHVIAPGKLYRRAIDNNSYVDPFIEVQNRPASSALQS